MPTKQKPAAPKVDRKPQPTPQPKSELKLTEFQTFVCDQVGDLILNGGHENDLTNLLYAAIGHYYRTMFPRKKMKDCAAGAGPGNKVHRGPYRRLGDEAYPAMARAARERKARSQRRDRACLGRTPARSAGTPR